MDKFISLWNPSTEKFNEALINREYDEDLMIYIDNACKSISSYTKNIQYLGYSVEYDESLIDINDYITMRKVPKKLENQRYIYTTDSRYGQVTLTFKVTGLNNKHEMTSHIINKKVLFITPDRDGYYTFKGKRYILLYQLVDSSTYKNRNILTLKSFVGIFMIKDPATIVDKSGNIYNTVKYSMKLFNRRINVLMLYMASFGAYGTLRYFDLHEVVSFTSEYDESDIDYIYFGISSKLFLKVDKIIFEKFKYVQSMVATFLDMCTNRMSMDTLEDIHFWIDRIGLSYSTNNTYQKGLNRLIAFDRMVDETTKSILRIKEEHKVSTYSIVRWLIQNFNELMKKDNMNLEYKRLRTNEYIASSLTKAFSRGISRVSALGDRATLRDYKSVFAFKGDVIITELFSTGLLRIDDSINDMDLFLKLKYTTKGPNALGGKNPNNILMRYRGSHPSYLGRIDINRCGSSDPGASGILTPMCKTDKLFFSSKNEPDKFKDDFREVLDEYMTSKGIFQVKSKEDPIIQIRDSDGNLRQVNLKEEPPRYFKTMKDEELL